MSELEKKKNIKMFIKTWKGRGYEKGESQTFWLTFLRDICGVERPERLITFEDQVVIDKTSFIDGRIPSTRVLIEQKSIGKNLNKPIKQSDGTYLTPYQQAQRYMLNLPTKEHPYWIVLSNFQEFHIYNMNTPHCDPTVVKLENLEKDYYLFNFLTHEEDRDLKREMEVSYQAGKIVGMLYDEILHQYNNPEDKESLESLNMLCVRLVFCLYAEDSGLFPEHAMFYNYLEPFRNDPGTFREKLIKLFKFLNQKPKDRDPYVDEELSKFPYVNGGLFANTEITVPRFTNEICRVILDEASRNFDWSEISPTIFGALFESTLNPDTRRKGGMHYTSIENIHKVIDPLFLNEIKEKLKIIDKSYSQPSKRRRELSAFQDKIASLKFLDPACGSGNFLTESYISLRKIENKIIQLQLANNKNDNQLSILNTKSELSIKVSIQQFYGIEYNDFATVVAKTALWIAEHQMLKETRKIVYLDTEFLPLKTYANIHEGNALRIDWNDVVPNYDLDFIMGNPPFVGYKFQSDEQKKDISKVFCNEKKSGALDYVACWYRKASEYMIGTKIETAFVSTNSIAQGEQVAGLWKKLMNEYNIKINYAYNDFKWKNEALKAAAVYCVIIGFSCIERSEKRIYTETGYKKAQNINAYLVDAKNIFIEKSSKPISSDVPIATKGNAAMDNGILQINEQEYQEIMCKYPELNPLIKRHMSADDFINNKKNYCFWLDGINLSPYRKNKFLMDKLLQVREYRNASKRKATKKMAEYPMLFAEIRQPRTNYIMIPVVSSENRRYIPMAFLTPDIINSYASISVPNASLYHFGILESNVHMAWMRAFAGRLEMRYRYATTLVYNTFPWPTPTNKQKNEIEKTAQGILNARALYSNDTLADLYDSITMPAELRRAHQLNDKAVMEAYGMKLHGEENTEAGCVAFLMNLYQDIVVNK